VVAVAEILHEVPIGIVGACKPVDADDLVEGIDLIGGTLRAALGGQAVPDGIILESETLRFDQRSRIARRLDRVAMLVGELPELVECVATEGAPIRSKGGAAATDFLTPAQATLKHTIGPSASKAKPLTKIRSSKNPMTSNDDHEGACRNSELIRRR
jgi:hypothetical protein